MRARPARLERLPEQYFGTLLKRVAAAGEVVDLGRGNPETGPPQHVVRRAGRRRQPAHCPRLRAVSRRRPARRRRAAAGRSRDCRDRGRTSLARSCHALEQGAEVLLRQTSAGPVAHGVWRSYGALNCRGTGAFEASLPDKAPSTLAQPPSQTASSAAEPVDEKSHLRSSCHGRASSECQAFRTADPSTNSRSVLCHDPCRQFGGQSSNELPARSARVLAATRCRKRPARALRTSSACSSAKTSGGRIFRTSPSRARAADEHAAVAHPVHTRSARSGRLELNAHQEAAAAHFADAETAQRSDELRPHARGMLDQPLVLDHVQHGQRGGGATGLPPNV